MGIETAVCSTANKVSPGKSITVWGDHRRSFNKGYRSNECSRCPASRDTKARYCQHCRRAYRQLRQILQRAA